MKYPKLTGGEYSDGVKEIVNTPVISLDIYKEFLTEKEDCDLEAALKYLEENHRGYERQKMILTELNIRNKSERTKAMASGAWTQDFTREWNEMRLAALLRKQRRGR